VDPAFNGKGVSGTASTHGDGVADACSQESKGEASYADGGDMASSGPWPRSSLAAVASSGGCATLKTKDRPSRRRAFVRRKRLLVLADGPSEEYDAGRDESSEVASVEDVQVRLKRPLPLLAPADDALVFEGPEVCLFSSSLIMAMATDAHSFAAL